VKEQQAAWAHLRGDMPEKRGRVLLMVQHVSPDRSIKELLGLKLTAVGLLKIACPLKVLGKRCRT
jgi:hypothetical protein